MTSANLTIQTSFDTFSDSRTHGYQGSTRNVRLQRVSPIGGGAISRSQDGLQCAVTGIESLRIVRIYDTANSPDTQNGFRHKYAQGSGGHCIDASRNFWENSGLKLDSTSTDVAWCHGQFSNKIITSARNGEVIMWDLNKSGSTKFERKVKDHLRSIHRVCVSSIVSNYCISGSSDGDLRVWDLRNFNRSIMRIRHPTSVRGVVFSPVMWQPLQAAVGLDNGNIYRWDLKMGQRGQLDRIPVAHSGSVTSLDWCSSSSATSSATPAATESTGNGQGWIVSGGLDRCVKVWDLTSLTSTTSPQHIPHKPAYVLHPSFPVRHVSWRPGYDCEIAVVSNADFGTGSNSDMGQPTNEPAVVTGLASERDSGTGYRDALMRSNGTRASATTKASPAANTAGVGDAVEIWDVRRSWIAKWTVPGSVVDGGCTDIAFGDSHAIWAQHYSGMFSQIDLRDTTKPIDAIPRTTVAWEASGSVTFVADTQREWEVPYDDLLPEAKKEAAAKGRKVKHLGDSVYGTTSQGIGIHYGEEDLYKLDIFTRLAKQYLIEGEDRTKVCLDNAQAAFEVGHHQAVQVWLLMGASVTDIVPDAPSGVPPTRQFNKARRPKSMAMEHSYSAPAAISSTPFIFPPAGSKTSPGRASTHSSDKVSVQNGNGRVSQRSLSATSSGLRHVTPGSSTNSSPRQASSALPPATPLSPMTSKYPYLGRRESVDSGLSAGSSSHHGGAASGARRPSVLQRPSLSMTHSPSSSSLKHVGEGALDDSDSDTSDSGDKYSMGKNGALSDDDEEASELRPLISPALAPTTRIANPSPLSRILQHRWAVDEDGMNERDDDDETPSPRSTDSESISGVDVGSTPHATRSTVTRRRSSTTAVKRKQKSKSQSSITVQQTDMSFSSGTGAQPRSASRHLSLPPPKLVHRNSSSSVCTVTAVGEDKEQSQSVDSQVGAVKDPRNSTRHHHNREKSLAVSELVLNGNDEDNNTSQPAFNEALVITWTQRDPELVISEEQRFRQMAWDAIRESLEEFAEMGDVQMCAMLAILVPQELRLPRRRILGFIDKTLTRLKLYACAAYIRKHCTMQDIYSATLLETTIYTTCGRCRKGFAAQSIGGYCSVCRMTTVTCSICRLPVRGLLFQCSICSHGGHHACYSQYYAQRSMVQISPNLGNRNTLLEDRVRPGVSGGGENEAERDEAGGMNALSSVNAGTGGGQYNLTDTPKFAGRPCAAGCGHYCWLVNSLVGRA
ncbi:hypothetical protein K435DRAFT_854840 [Dendrothele bispora CBS 962.96]|uniref:WDR59/RTC1-like RING zinc finger domain-containing protein n=1 Tax=Dendrothele bispora (strain CBS 962.96) TaxID=1314807 RepID=A0A4S8MCV9_DENBC|nr:hypothetical protein K435DRAFT_854840 [Dendrothele bispora CBS 962.96]